MIQRGLIVVLLFVCLVEGVRCKSNGGKLTRRKRYVSFPEGAAFSAVVCMTSQTGITGISEGINWGFVYDLPNDTRPLFSPHKALQKRRSRRDVYLKLEDILTSIGYNGRICILRALCETERQFQLKESSLAHQLLNIIFRFPKEPVKDDEPDDHRLYHWAAQIGSGNFKAETVSKKELNQDCSDIFQCPFSLIDLALGHYSASFYDNLNIYRQ